VDNPDHARVHGIEGEYSLIIELQVAKEDIGKVMRVDRTFAWEDKFKRLLLRFEHIQQRHFGMKLLA